MYQIPHNSRKCLFPRVAKPFGRGFGKRRTTVLLFRLACNSRILVAFRHISHNVFRQDSYSLLIFQKKIRGISDLVDTVCCNINDSVSKISILSISSVLSDCRPIESETGSVMRDAVRGVLIRPIGMRYAPMPGNNSFQTISIQFSSQRLKRGESTFPDTSFVHRIIKPCRQEVPRIIPTIVRRYIRIHDSPVFLHIIPYLVSELVFSCC